MAFSLLFIVLRIPIWPRLAKYRATSRARCVQPQELDVIIFKPCIPYPLRSKGKDGHSAAAQIVSG